MSYLCALTSLLHNAAEDRCVIENSGSVRKDLSHTGLLERIDTNRVYSISYRLRGYGSPISLNIKYDRTLVTIRTTIITECDSMDLIWLQSAQTANMVRDPFAILALPVHRDGATVETLQPLVALGVYSGKLTDAECRFSAGGQLLAKWTIDRQSRHSRPLLSLSGDAIWFAGSTDLLNQSFERPAIWFTPYLPILNEHDIELTQEWWNRFGKLCDQETPDYSALEAHLAPLLKQRGAWINWNLAGSSASDSQCPALVIDPESDHIQVILDPVLTSLQRQRLLLHALAHLALGHIRVGDSSGHRDDLDSVINPSRHRDLLVGRFVDRYWHRPGGWGIDRLADCTRDQKMKLKRWKILNDRLGNVPHLHARAFNYQTAAYQRQAAARLVGILDKYRGAMLCDGVGLGKTYVATTIMIHFANQWRDQKAERGEAHSSDPYRISVIVPNQVVSAWRSEALPSVYAYGVDPGTIRIIQHSDFTRITKNILKSSIGQVSDLEHLILSDLVIVDEAHAFRSEKSNRIKFLRNILCMQPRQDGARRVQLLTATPINNKLDDLRFQLSLVFPPTKKMGSSEDACRYREEAVELAREIVARLSKSRSISSLNGMDFNLHRSQFRADLDFGPQIPSLDQYLKHQDEQLGELVNQIRETVEQNSQLKLFDVNTEKNRIAEDLLDQIIVQRSRAMCTRIETDQGAECNLLFRSRRSEPIRLEYAQDSESFEAILQGLLQLFGSAENGADPLTLRVYLWQTRKKVKPGAPLKGEKGSVIGLQRTQLLKRLESSLPALLISLVRLIVLHASKLHALEDSARVFGELEKERSIEIRNELEALFTSIDPADLNLIIQLVVGRKDDTHGWRIIRILSDDPVSEILTHSEFLRLWELKGEILADFARLLRVTPRLIARLLCDQSVIDWPKRFVTGKDRIDWPNSAHWGHRLVSDEKIYELVKYLLNARRKEQKVVVFSQFTHTVLYIKSVFNATVSFTTDDWTELMAASGPDQFKREEIESLRNVMESLDSQTSNRERVINRFAPFYRIGPWRPDLANLATNEREGIHRSWEREWTEAITRPIDVLLTTDILAEGVNLQDVAILINFDVHWNPVKMIQRAGRIDRRLNPRIEESRRFPDLEELAARLNMPVPKYYWHDHPKDSPQIVNMILPDKLEDELKLREKISIRSLLIDLTLGLEQGTGAEADWMNAFVFKGVSDLNSTAGDRTIEKLVTHHDRLARELMSFGIRTEWANELPKCLNPDDAGVGSVINNVVCEIWPVCSEFGCGPNHISLDNERLLEMVERPDAIEVRDNPTPLMTDQPGLCEMVNR